jgi:hypothetical protein
MRLRAAHGAMAAAVLAGGLLTGAAACSEPVACAGPCGGPPYVLQVIFRPGITTQAATATLRHCATGPVVIRRGPLAAGPKTSGGKPEMIVNIFTRTAASSQTSPLLSCLKHASTVQGAAFPG